MINLIIICIKLGCLFVSILYIRVPQKAFIYLTNMAASESRDLVVMETGLKITTCSMMNIL